MASSWSKWFRILHRDVGYIAVALVLAYGLSGLAVNHIEDWNPSYRFAESSFDVGALPAGTAAEQADAAVARLRLDPRTVRGHFLESATDLRVFLDDGQEARLDTTTGKGRLKTITRRAVLFEVNALHLNNLKGVCDEAFLVAQGIAPTARAEELAVADYVRLANALS